MKLIKVNSFTLYFILILMLCGFLKTGIIIFFIILWHEMGHIIIAKVLNYKINSVTIYPFGGITKLEKDINTPLNHELMIASGGVYAQLVLQILLLFLPFNKLTLNIFYKYNISIMLFNLIPIIPLDGSVIFNVFFNKLFSFKISYFLTIITSSIGIIIYLLFNWWYSVNNYFIVMLFIYKTYDYLKNYKFIYNRFLLERYLNDYKFKYLSTKEGNLDILKLDTYQYFKDNGKIIGEKRRLQERFDKYSKFW